MGEGSALMDAARAHSLLDGKSPGQRAKLNERCKPCHLDAEMVARGLSELKPQTGAAIFIETPAISCARRYLILGNAPKSSFFRRPRERTSR
jgi:Ni2+-binding GTPase involved in maturation of urease and hydrogenase